MKEFESLIKIILINNFNCSMKKLFLFYVPTLCVRPRDILFWRFTAVLMLFQHPRFTDEGLNAGG